MVEWERTERRAQFYQPRWSIISSPAIWRIQRQTRVSWRSLIRSSRGDSYHLLSPFPSLCLAPLLPSRTISRFEEDVSLCGIIFLRSNFGRLEWLGTFLLEIFPMVLDKLLHSVSREVIFLKKVDSVKDDIVGPNIAALTQRETSLNRIESHWMNHRVIGQASIVRFRMANQILCITRIIHVLRARKRRVSIARMLCKNVNLIH